MTAYAGTRLTYRPYLPPMGKGALDGTRRSLREFGSAFRVARTDLGRDVDALLLLARD